MDVAPQGNHSIYIITGSNIGKQAENLKTAYVEIARCIGRISKVSSIYETAPWGNANQENFLNQVLEVQSGLSPEEALKACLRIEEKMGRVRNKKNDPRIIDIDILFYDSEVLHEPGLRIPHPEIQNRRFALVPMHELHPDFEHPGLKKTIAFLLETTPDTLPVHKV